MIVLLDVGNSRFKWAVLEDVEQFDVHHEDYSGPSRAQAVFASLHELRPRRIIVSSVLGNAFQDTFRGMSRNAFNVEPEFVKTTHEAYGIRVAYAVPANLGVDRFVAMIAAHALYDTSCIIVDSGTAVTIDALSAEGRHQGGLILPGLALMRHCLTKKAANIKLHSRVNETTLFAKDTAEAVNSGRLRTIAAAVDQITADMAVELEFPVTQILCGGDGEIIQPWLRREYTLNSDLVIKGLALIANN